MESLAYRSKAAFLWLALACLTVSALACGGTSTFEDGPYNKDPFAKDEQSVTNSAPSADAGSADAKVD